MTFVIVLMISGFFASAVVAYFKLGLARLALKDVPPEKRAEVLDAVGRVFERWRLR